jgi:caa(3)-type oxidase subunit IV
MVRSGGLGVLGKRMMSARVDSPFTHFAVFIALVIFTCITMALSFVPIAGKWHMLLGLLIGLTKASLVGLFFMHLIDSRPTVWAIIFVSLFWATIVLGSLTFSDYLTRQWIPFVPGH